MISACRPSLFDTSIGEISLLSAPNVKWEIISVDFIMKLSKSISFDVMITIVDPVIGVKQK